MSANAQRRIVDERPRPLPVARLEPRFVGLINSLATPRTGFVLEAQGRQLALRLEPVPYPPAAGLRLQGRLDGWPFEVLAPEGLFRDQLAPSILAAPGHPLAAAVLEMTLAPWLEALERRLGCAVAITELDARPLEPVAARLGLGSHDPATREAAGASITIGLGEGAARRFVSCVERLPPAPRRDDRVPFLVRVEVARLTLSVGELRSAEPGDMILVPGRARLPIRRAQLVIADGFAAAVAIGGERVRVLAQARPAAEPPMGEAPAMSETPETPAPLLTDPDALPVTLSFDLGHVEMTLGELQRLGVGHVFPLPRPLDGCVDVLANGRRIGEGELVAVGEGVAVRLVRLFERDAPP